MADSSRQRRTRSGAYAKVWDGFTSHAKVATIPRSIRAEALGTWVLCLSWSNQQLTDGYVPAYVVEELGGTMAGAEALVSSGLWRKRNGGFGFVNWSESQSTREQVEAKRRVNADRQKRHRDRLVNAAQGSGTVTRDDSATNAQSESKTETETETSDSLRSSLSPTDENSPPPVDNSNPDLEQVRARLGKHYGAPVSKSAALFVLGQLVQRRGPKAPPLKRPTAWALKSIDADWAECNRWLSEIGAGS